MRVSSCIGALALIATAGTAFGAVSSINSVQEADRIFNDFTTTTLTVTNNYATSYRIQETGFVDDGIGGNFANFHAAWFSADSGATAYDFNYGDSFDAKVTVQDSSSGIGAVEAGFKADLFGFGFFGGLPGNGEIAAFGSTLPFHSFGTGLYTPGDTLDLRMIYRAGTTEFVDTSYIQYLYQLNGGGWNHSPWIPYTNTEMGIPSGIPDTQFIQKIGFGAQFNNPIGGTADVLFSNIMITPTPGAAALFGIAGLAGIRRRR
jgi:hypothetical protein